MKGKEVNEAVQGFVQRVHQQRTDSVQFAPPTFKIQTSKFQVSGSELKRILDDPRVVEQYIKSSNSNAA